MDPVSAQTLLDIVFNSKMLHRKKAMMKRISTAALALVLLASGGNAFVAPSSRSVVKISNSRAILSPLTSPSNAIQSTSFSNPQKDSTALLQTALDREIPRPDRMVQFRKYAQVFCNLFVRKGLASILIQAAVPCLQPTG